MTRHRNRSVVVTGASSGIGRAAALAFARPGTFLLLTARRGRELEEVATACRGRGATVTVVPADVTDAGAMKEVARRAVTEFGRLDVWVNNAAVVAYGPTEEMPAELWRRVVDVNLVGAYHGVRAALPWFREQGAGVLINVSSLLGRTPPPNQSAYAVSKQALRTLSDCLRHEVRDAEGIAICTVLPGVTDTPLFGSGANFTGREPRPPGPMIDAREVAAAIVRCADRPRPEVVVGATTWVGRVVTRLAPRLSERALANVAEQRYFSDRPVPRTDGNVFAPLPTGAHVDGGWRQPDGGRAGDSGYRRLGRALAWTAAAAAAVTLARAARSRGGRDA